MPARLSASPWTSRLRGRSSRRQSDWADLGTAFGLDQSLQARVERGADPCGSRPEASLALSLPRRSWWRRLARKAFGWA